MDGLIGNKCLTVMTSPMPLGRYFVHEVARRCYRFLKYCIKRDRRLFLGGHYAVTRSLIEGLSHCNLPYIYNPINLAVLDSCVVVLAGQKTLSQVISFKKRGLVKFIAAGPNISTFSSDFNSILADKLIDMILVPSRWVANMYLEDHPELESKIVIWPSGVDAGFWAPELEPRKRSVILYDKLFRGDRRILGEVRSLLDLHGFSVSVIKYGEYSKEQYLAELHKAEFLVGFSDSESQGIAWAEAWSANVPTFLLKNEVGLYSGRTYLCSTAPYLTKENGVFFSNSFEFGELLGLWKSGGLNFSPRQWVLANMTDEVCAMQLYNWATKC